MYTAKDRGLRVGAFRASWLLDFDKAARGGACLDFLQASWVVETPTSRSQIRSAIATKVVAQYRKAMLE